MKIFSTVIRGLAPVVVLAILSGCSGGGEDTRPEPMKPTISKAELDAAASKRVIFAHQSVGANILNGVQTLATQNHTLLNVQDITAGTPPTSPGIYHFMVGDNGDPQGKLAAYRTALESADLTGVDVALVKLCYIDFAPNTDSKALAQDYIQTLNGLQAKHPQTRFVAITAPLTAVQSGPKAWVKRLLGRSPSEYAENERRYEFNQQLRSAFDANHLFDVAKLEAEAGTKTQRYDYQGKPLEALDPALTYDGGHLNDAGEQVVAASFLKVLASTPQQQ